MLKYDIDSLYRILEDDNLEYVLSSYNNYLDFLENTWFFEGDITLDERYMKSWEPTIIAFYNNYNNKEGGEN